LCIPAHVDRPSYSIIANLGFIPPDLEIVGVEISHLFGPKEARVRFPQLERYTLVANGDAHRLKDMAKRTTLKMAEATTAELSLALAGEGGQERVGGWNSVSEMPLTLWIENAHQSLLGAGSGLAPEEVRGDVVRTFQTEEQFFIILASGPQGGAEGKAKAAPIADRVASMLEQGASLDTVVATILAALPNGEHVPFSILQVLGGCQAHLVECDAPPLFLTRGGRLVLLPVLEDISHGRLVRECRFLLEDGDHLAMVSEGYIRAKGWSRRWGVEGHRHLHPALDGHRV